MKYISFFFNIDLITSDVQSTERADKSAIFFRCRVLEASKIVLINSILYF